MINDFSFKELYDLSLKTTNNIEIDNKLVKKGETIAFFDKILLSNFEEIKDHVTAHGGYGDETRVNWDTTKELRLNFSQGVFSKLQFALMSNSRLLTKDLMDPLPIFRREETESDADGKITIKYDAWDQYDSILFIYDKDGNKLTYNKQDSKHFYINDSYKDVIVDYYYNYNNNTENIYIGKPLITGELFMEAKTRIKDDTTGHTVTGILTIPRFKLLSDLSMRLGREAQPVVSNFSAAGYPIGEGRDKTVMIFHMLHDDIDTDM